MHLLFISTSNFENKKNSQWIKLDSSSIFLIYKSRGNLPLVCDIQLNLHRLLQNVVYPSELKKSFSELQAMLLLSILI